MEQLPKIVQRGLREAAQPGNHPDPDLLAAFAEKSLLDRERALVMQHLAACGDCRDVVALAMPQLEDAPSPTPGRSSPERSLWLSWPMLRWGALAACVVVVSAAVTLHYERRQPADMVAEKTLEAPANLTAENNGPQPPPPEKLAAKTPVPAPFQDRDLNALAGKLAAPREQTKDAGTAAARAGVSAPHRQDGIQGVQESSNNRLANADALKSASTLSAPAAPVATAVPPPPTTAASAESRAVAAQNKVHPGAVGYVAGAAAETVTIDAAAGAAGMQKTAEGKAKDESLKKESANEVRAVTAGAASTASLGDRKADTPSSETAQIVSVESAKRPRAHATISPRWSISADGDLQRSFDGKTWQTVPVASNVVFRALAANASDVWVGGAAGALYHSSDAGLHWTQVKPVAAGKPLTADIVTVEFGDAQHGALTTSNGEMWNTSDAGSTWQSH